MSRKKIWKIYALIVLLVVVLSFGYWQTNRNKTDQNLPDSAYSTDYFKTDFVPETQTRVEETQPENFPPKFLIADFPFQTQAPLVIWDELHDEACEEASVILVNYFLQSQNISAETMDEEILKMVDWQTKNWGEHRDLTVAETLEMAKKIYHLDGDIITNANIDVLKQQIASGQPVIVPTAGRLLGNPNFRSPGPVYHMVVAIGYDEKNIIVQDVGTRNGNQYVYNQKIFYNAWHDWTGNPENITDGARNLLILTPR